MGIDPPAEKIEPAGPEAAFLQGRAELHNQLADVAGDGFCGGDRLGKAAAHLDKLGKAQGVDGLGRMP